jgi:hypothetical protein
MELCLGLFGMFLDYEEQERIIIIIKIEFFINFTF